jgi:endogenous inhibitor of DNA gyrase (YacG/DUF329 family)
MRCPICKKAVIWESNPTRPFCSERCRLIDLGNWAGEKYSLPAEEVEAEDDAEREHRQDADG